MILRLFSLGVLICVLSLVMQPQLLAQGSEQSCTDDLLPDPTLPNPPGWAIDYDPIWLPGPPAELEFIGDFFELRITKSLVGSFTAAELSHATATVNIGITVTSDQGIPQEQLALELFLRKQGVVRAHTDYHVFGIPAGVPTPVTLALSAADFDEVECHIYGFVGGAIEFSNWSSSACMPTWTDLGSGLAGVGGVPVLAGTGTLAGGSAGMLSLSSAKASSPAAIFIALASAPAAFKGGTLVAFPFLLMVPLATNGSGALALPFNWPSGLPPHTALYFQYAIQDAASPFGVSLSNGLMGVTP